jgi:GTP-sensing pleiotropic transcriptional regulator CodY
MNVYEKIDAIFSGQAEDRPVWANEILEELRTIKALIQTNHTTTNHKIDTHYYEFVKELRQIMQPNVSQGIYPKIDYHNKTLGINFKGHLYDIHQHQTLTKKEAFSAYEYFYNNRENLHIYK